MDGLHNPSTAYVRPPLAPKPQRPAKAPVAKAPLAPKPHAAPRAPAVTPTSTAMDAFRTAMQQLQAATPQVDSNAIYAPYRASEAVTGQLGQGLQQSLLNSGQAAQTQYGNALDQAQQHAAQFGISTGAGAAPTALQNTGAAPLAQQTAAYAAAAPQAAAAWQQALERTAGAKVSAAELQREQGLTAAKQSLATSLPSAIQNEETRAFQQHTQGFNERLAESQLSAKQAADLRNFSLGAAKVQQSAKTAATTAGIKKASLAEKTTNDQANLRVKQDALALKRRSSQATAQGLKGISAATKALSGSTSSAGTKKVAKGFDVQVQPWDAANNKPSGPATTKHLPRLDVNLPGYKVLGKTATTHYETVGTSAGSAGLTASQWDVQMRSLLAQNPGRAADVKRFLGPRPKK